jgi:hypothetical protein
MEHTLLTFIIVSAPCSHVSNNNGAENECKQHYFGMLKMHLLERVFF